MEAKKWTELWLGYQKAYEGDGAWKTVTEGFSDSQVVIANALYEFIKCLQMLVAQFFYIFYFSMPI